MNLHRIRHKLLISLALAMSIGIIAIAYFFNMALERSIHAEYQRTLHRLTDSVVMSIETIMTENHAEIMPEYARRLKALPGLIDFRIGRLDGSEAYIDNKTIQAVNQRLGEPMFQLRNEEKTSDPVFDPKDSTALLAIQGKEGVSRTEHTAEHGNIIHFFDPIPNTKNCVRCHGNDSQIRGVLKVSASLADVEKEMLQARLTSLSILALSLLVTMSITGYMLGRSVATPIENVTQAMARVSSGDFNLFVPVERSDELGHMANSFNKMTSELRGTYAHMLSEKEKLATVIQGAREAVVVTDPVGRIILVNASASEILGKSEQAIREGGMLNLLDDPVRLGRLLEASEEQAEPLLMAYRERWLEVSASTIRNDLGQPIGSAALLRDVTQARRLLAELERLSTTDALTDVYNRRHLDLSLKTEVERASQMHLPLSVIMFDVDHFKKFNDTYGHDQGDRVLKMVGQVMKAAVRKYDVPCRYGGEEFTVILPSTEAHGALAVAERLRCDIEAMRVDGLQVTISLGIACYPEIALSTPESLILAADAALYRAKDGGRNRSVIATPAMLEGAT